MDTPARRPLFPHMPALDGLRGLALLGVLFFHANGMLRGGFLGVDLFFVLSGYLITSLLLAEHEARGAISLKDFWIRRARRLLPALLALVPVVVLHGRLFGPPSALAGLRADVLATLGYVANWRAIYAHRSYWEIFTSRSPLEHTWSLAIEEQFYVVWPLVIVLVLSRWARRGVLVLTLALAALSAIAMLVLFAPESTTRVYMGTDTRASGILLGAALATVLTPRAALSAGAVRLLDGAGVISAIGLAIAWSVFDGQSWLLYHGGFWLTELGALVLIACAVQGSRSLVARALAWRPLAWVGTISYGVYLWHWPVHVFVSSDRLHGPALTALRFAITFAVALVSYRFLERPIRERGLPKGRSFWAVPAGVTLGLLIAVRATHAQDGEAPKGSSMINALVSAVVKDEASFRVVVVGDSTANTLGWALRGLQERGLAVDLHGRDGCTIMADLCGMTEWPALLAQAKPDAAVLYLGGAFMHGITVNDEWTKACKPAWHERFEANLVTNLDELRNPHVRVWMATVPYALGDWETKDVHEQVTCINRSIRKVVATLPDVALLDLQEHICPAGECRRMYEDGAIRPDGVHFTIEGARGVARWTLAELRAKPRVTGSAADSGPPR
ncbi:DUF459 domain-containing protein [Sorangium sp. So ce381]|uniref:DUF459 domain-containing protein n=1 Tax=Sorangium sp. So ce381 TaxID=3133307 RepID=UPI003F5C162E